MTPPGQATLHMQVRGELVGANIVTISAITVNRNGEVKLGCTVAASTGCGSNPRNINIQSGGSQAADSTVLTFTDAPDHGVIRRSGSTVNITAGTTTGLWGGFDRGEYEYAHNHADSPTDADADALTDSFEFELDGRTYTVTITINQPPAVVATPSTPGPYPQGAEATFDVASDFTDPNGDTLGYALGTVTGPVDPVPANTVMLSGSTVTISAAAPAGTYSIPVTAEDDGELSVTRTYTVIVSTDPFISITAGAAVSEGDPATFTVTASTAPASDLTVNVRVDDGADDFILGAAPRLETVTILATMMTAPLTVATVDDDVDEPNGSITAEIQSGPGYIIATSPANSATVMVNDDDADTAMPVFTIADVDGDTLILTYNEELDGRSVPAAGDFAVMAGRAVSTVDMVEVIDVSVILILSAPVNVGADVTVSYTPGAAPIQDTSGNAALGLTDVAVTNNTQDTTPPMFTTAEVSGDVLVLTYNEVLDDTSTPAVMAFTVLAGSAQATVSTVAVRSTTVILTLSAPVGSTDVVTVSYSPPVGEPTPIQDIAGNEAVRLTPQMVTNTTGPLLTVVDNQVYTVGTAIAPLVLPEAVGGTGNITYTLTGPSAATLSTAVPGLMFNADTRELSGTPTMAGGPTTLTYTATDSATSPAATERTFTVTVNPEPLALPTVDAQTYTAGTAIRSLTLPAATGGTGDITYTLTGPNMTDLSQVPGLVFNADTRVLSGTPVVAGGPTTLTYTARDSASTPVTAAITFTITVSPAPLALPRLDSPLVYPVGTAIAPLELPEATGGTGTITYNLTGPNGIDLSELPWVMFDANTRVMSGIPTTESDDPTTLTYWAQDSTFLVTQTTFTVVTPAPSEMLTLPMVDDQEYMAGTAITSLVLPEATGGIGNITYTLTGPNGMDLTEVPELMFDARTRELAGTPTTAGGPTTLTYTARDSATDAAVVRQTFTVTVTADMAAPMLDTAAVNGNTLVLTYDEALDGGSVPAATAFTIGGVTATVTTVAVSGTTVTLTLSAPVNVGAGVTVSYTPGAAPIQDTSGNAAGPLSTHGVKNNTPPPAPTGVTAISDTSGLLVVSWTAPDPAPTGGYNVQYSTDAGSTWESLRVVAVGNTMYAFTGLAAGTYSSRVRSAAGGVNSAWVQAAAVQVDVYELVIADSIRVERGDEISLGCSISGYDATNRRCNDPSESILIDVVFRDRPISEAISSNVRITYVTAPMHGELRESSALSASETIVVSSIREGRISYLPTAGTTATSDSFEIEFSGVRATVTLSIFNLAPRVEGSPSAGPYTAGTAGTFDVANDFADASRETLTFRLGTVTGPVPGAVTLPSGSTVMIGATATATATAGTYNVPVLASDGLAETPYTYVVVVNPMPGGTNQAPTVVGTPSTPGPYTAGTAATFDVNDDFSDPDAGDTLSYTLGTVTGPMPTAVTLSGSTVTIADTATPGTYNIPVVAQDNGSPMLSVLYTYQVLVEAANQAPVVVGTPATPGPYLAGEVSFFDVSVDFQDPEGGTLTYTLGTVTGTAGTTLNAVRLPSGSSTVMIGATATATAGTYTIPVTATDPDGLMVTHEYLVEVLATPEVSIRALTRTITEGTLATFTVTASPAPASALTVSVNVTDSGAFASSGQTGVRMVTVSGRATAFSVSTEDDSVSEMNGSITATIQPSTDIPPTYTVAAPPGNSAMVTVNDNDSPELTITGGAAVTEGTAATFTVTASPAPASDLTVSVRVDDGAGDFIMGTAPRMEMVTIPGNATTATLTVDTVDDDVDESNGSITVEIQPGSGYIAARPPANSATVTVNDNDETVPTLQTAGVNGNSLILTYSEALDTTSIPIAGAFTVMVGSSTATVSTVMVRSTTVILTLSEAVSSTDVVTVSYTPPSENPIQGTSSNEALALTGRRVTNNTPAATVLPSISIMRETSLVTEGTDAPFMVMASPAPTSDLVVDVIVTEMGDFIVGISPVMATVTINPSATEARLRVPTMNDDVDESSGSITATIQPGLGYTVGAPDSATVTINDDDDMTVPMLQTATVDGDTLVLTYDEVLDGSSEPAARDFMVTVGEEMVAVSTVVVSGMTVTLTLSAPVIAEATVTLAYTRGTNPIRDVAMNNAINLSDEAVMNNTLATRELVREVAVGVAGRAVAASVAGVVRGRLRAPRGFAPISQARLLDTVNLGTLGSINKVADLKPLLLGSEFAYTLAAAGGGSPVTDAWEVWGRGSWRRLSGEDGSLDWKGNQYGFHLGLDRTYEDLLMGVMVGYHTGALDYRLRGQGELDSYLLSVHPYLALDLTPQLQIWAAIGYGAGDVEDTTAANTKTKEDLSLWTGSVGLDGRVETEGGIDAAVSGFMSVANTAESQEDTRVYLLGIEAEFGRRVEVRGGTARPFLLVAGRHDGGDLESGTALEVGGGLEWQLPESGISVSLRGRTQVNSTANEEHGVSGELRYDLHGDGLGLDLSLVPQFGGATTMRLDPTQPVSRVSSEQERSVGLVSELGYGLATSKGLLRPHGRVALDESLHRLELGLRLESHLGIDLELDLERSSVPGAGSGADHAGMVNTHLRF